MTTDEMIAVLQAYKEGKKIEVRYIHSKDDWVVALTPCWDFATYTYRVKPEPHCRPFESAEEVMEAIKEHGDWVKHDNDIERVFSFNHKTVNLTYSNILYSDAFKMYSFYDGTPFGKLVDESNYGEIAIIKEYEE